MAKKLPHRPNLDLLRKKAKQLLSDLQAGQAKAIQIIREHLPAAAQMSQAEIKATTFRLADAQLAVARESGFGSWPRLARHIDQLRALEGTWSFAHLEVEGNVVPSAMTQFSRILIDGDCFRTESPEGNYEGIFNIDVECEPAHIDIEFVAGPGAGNSNFGIYRLDGDQLEISLNMGGKNRAVDFATTPGSGCAYEKLIRQSADRPAEVKGGSPPVMSKTNASSQCSEFAFVESRSMNALQGTFSAVSIERDGEKLPPFMLKTAKRTSRLNQVEVALGGQVIIQALVRIDESASPIHIDYFNLSGPFQGTVQLGILEIGDDGSATINMSLSESPRPTTFSAPRGSGCTLSKWRPD